VEFFQIFAVSALIEKLGIYHHLNYLHQLRHYALIISGEVFKHSTTRCENAPSCK
jgi:hypothetical protein